MKRPVFYLGVALVLAGALYSAFQRTQDESHHRRTALIADWTELRLAVARQYDDPKALLAALRDHGVEGIVVQPLTLEQLAQDKKVLPLGVSPGQEALDTSVLSVPDPALASLLYWEWTHRGVSRLERPVRDGKTGHLLLKRDGASFAALKDVESAFDPELLAAAREMDIGLVFRLSQDPWLESGDIETYINEHPLFPYAQALIWNTETPLGGWTAFAAWQSWMQRHHVQTLLFEFKPPRSQRKMAKQLPYLAQRAHTIAVNELREMRPEQELARWRRAALERSCRFLLVHVSPDQSLDAYLTHTSLIGDRLQKAGLSSGWPTPHNRWRPTPGWWSNIVLLLAFVIAAMGPLLGLFYAPKEANPVLQFLAISAVTLTFGLTAAALANLPETRLQTIPFRGVKFAFLIGWLGSLFLLYRPQEMAQFLVRSVRRLDLLIGVFVLGALGYVMLRTGNAGSGWTSSLEQPVRDALESLFVVRPRFKEFAFGHPLLLAGLFAARRRSPWIDARLLMFLGMVGQVSMMNTFAHLHSPIVLGVARSLIGLGLGVMLGWLLNKIVSTLEKRVAI